MATNLHTYIGPFIQCKVTYVPGTEAKQGCSGEKCHMFQLNLDNDHFNKVPKFCPECGSKITTFHTPTQEKKADCWELIEKLDGLDFAFGQDGPEPIYDDGTEVFQVFVQEQSGKRPGQPREFHFDPEEEAVFEDLTSTNRKKEMEWFADSFAAELSKIVKAYGNNVKVRWGFLQWYS